MTDWATPYVGIPFLNKGRDRAGIDCYGLLRLIFWEQRTMWMPTLVDAYDDASDPAQTAPLIEHGRDLHWSRMVTPSEFDAVLFKIAGNPSHVGVMIDRSRFIHSMRGRDTTIGHITCPVWKKRIEGFYRCTS